MWFATEQTAHYIDTSSMSFRTPNRFLHPISLGANQPYSVIRSHVPQQHSPAFNNPDNFINPHQATSKLQKRLTAPTKPQRSQQSSSSILNRPQQPSTPSITLRSLHQPAPPWGMGREKMGSMEWGRGHSALRTGPDVARVSTHHPPSYHQIRANTDGCSPNNVY